MQAEVLLREGRLDDALRELESSIRKNPSDAKLRVFLFQLLCVRGDWDRALTQLNVAAEMNPLNLLMAQVCRPALACEALRRDVFQGKRTPLVLGQPDEWVGWIIESSRLTAAGKHADAESLRARALDAAPAVAGTIDGQPFAWIADADSRLGPMLEAIVDGKYYWTPFSNVSKVTIDEPADLRDAVWAPAHFTWTNGGQTVGLIPTRYPGSESSSDAAVRLARTTAWETAGSETYLGVGHRVWATDAGEHPLLKVREVTLGPQPIEAARPPEPTNG